MNRCYFLLNWREQALMILVKNKRIHICPRDNRNVYISRALRKYNITHKWYDARRILPCWYLIRMSCLSAHSLFLLTFCSLFEASGQNRIFYLLKKTDRISGDMGSSPVLVLWSSLNSLSCYSAHVTMDIRYIISMYNSRGQVKWKLFLSVLKFHIWLTLKTLQQGRNLDRGLLDSPFWIFCVD
jgi:hypothetical protein